jgi:hypothetical protein
MRFYWTIISKCDKIELGGVEVNKKDINDLLAAQGRSKEWLIKQLNIPRSTFYYKLDNGFTDEEKKNIERILGGK